MTADLLPRETTSRYNRDTPRFGNTCYAACLAIYVLQKEESGEQHTLRKVSFCSHGRRAHHGDDLQPSYLVNSDYGKSIVHW